MFVSPCLSLQVCEGSICQKIGWEQCYLTQDNKDDFDKGNLCFVACASQYLLLFSWSSPYSDLRIKLQYWVLSLLRPQRTRHYVFGSPVLLSVYFCPYKYFVTAANKNCFWSGLLEFSEVHLSMP